MNIELSIIILAYNEADNLRLLIPKVKSSLEAITSKYEILVLDGNSSDKTAEVAKSFGCRVIFQTKPGYGNAFKQALTEAKGEYAINIDADCSHDPKFIASFWPQRKNNQLIIASRYIKGGQATMPIFRKALSLILNWTYSFILSLSYQDLSSGFRMYKLDSVKDLIPSISARDFDVLLEILIKMHCQGYKIAEIPFSYQPRQHGKSTVKLFKFGLSYLKTLYHSWQLRNSAFSADYDDRAFNSIIPLQRYWQRRRYGIIMDMAKDSDSCIDLGCGSSKIIQNLPHSVGLDIDLKKLRYIKRSNRLVVKGDISNLPFRNNAFSTLICSQVMEHISKESFNLKELYRVLEKDGRLILGTPDYATFWWRFFEWFYIRLLPQAYGEGHIAPYTRREVQQLLEEHGFKILNYKYICKGELIIKSKKVSN